MADKKNNQIDSFKDLKIPSKFPFPYIPESYSKADKEILLKFFSNWDKPVFAIFSLPQEVVGAMFSRYSRTAKTMRRLFLDEFWNSEELGINKLTTDKNNQFAKAFERTKTFYQRVFAEYGDDSVIQMGSVHIAFEFVSQIHGAKAVEDQRMAAGYIEKSTRYVDFGSNINGHYLFMEPEEIMKSIYAKEFLSWNNSLFNSYIKFLPEMIEYLTQKYPIEDQNIEAIGSGELKTFKKLKEEDKEKVQTAYNRAIKAKAFDTIRFFLPLTTVTNLGAHFSGQAAELTINKMLISPYSEARMLGLMAYQELLKVSPNFLQNVDHIFGRTARNYRIDVRHMKQSVTEKYLKKVKSNKKLNDFTARILDFDRDADIKIASQILFTGSNKNISKAEITDWAKQIKRKEGKTWSPSLLKIIYDSLPDRKLDGRNRRQKLPRAFEQAYIDVELYTDIGAYKDLQRNRLSSTERQIITTDDLYIPEEYEDPKLKDLFIEYKKLANETKKLNSKISKLASISDASEYVAILGNKVRYSVRANLRQWAFFTELRTISGGHPTYRKAMQEAAREIIKKMPFTEKLFAHIDWTPDYGLGRLKAEIWTQEKLSKLKK